MASKEKAPVEKGSGNVFADLGLADADTHLLKANLVARIGEAIRAAKLTQKTAAVRLGISQPDVSRLLRGDFRDYSLERLLRLLLALGNEVEIVVREPPPGHPGRLVVGGG